MSTHGEDDLIDVVARGMTRGEPSTQLRSTIRTRITSAPDPTRRNFWLPALAGAVALVLVVVVTRTEFGPRLEPLPSTHIALAQVTPPLPLESAPELTAVRPVETSPADGGAKSTQQRLVVEPLVIESLGTPLMAVTTNSGVMPIDIEDLRIEPLQIQ